MNLNDLSQKDLSELENYITTTLGSIKPEIKLLFQDLKNGKLKNRNVDTDALDFVYDGLSNIVDTWINKSKVSSSNIISSSPPISNALSSLFDRTSIFQNEEGVSLQDHVENLLLQNNYPKRSKHITLSQTQKLNSKFVKDNFIYLLRGAEVGQMSGFFSYQYCRTKLNLEQYCQANPLFTPNTAFNEHSQIGQGYFISATTKLPLTTKFCHKVGNQSGSIYILKVPVNEVFRLLPHKPAFLPPFINPEDFNEEEYVIPDYIMPNELLKEFEYTDYLGVFQYLTKNIGLHITPQDVGFSESIEQEKDHYLKEGDFFRETEEKMMIDWKKQNYKGALETVFQEFNKKYPGLEL